MPTIGLMTFHNSYNYGAVLQAYALQRKLSDMALDSEFIDYHNPAKFNKSRPFIMKLRHYGYQCLANCLTGSKRKDRTDSFRHKHLRASSRKFSDDKALYDDPPLYDAYIVGSDQVWNPARYGKADPSWFLTFAPKGKPRVAYAPSFGVSKISSSYEKVFREWINRIDYLSVREMEGKEIIFQLTGREAEVVLDPTLLLSEQEWAEVSEPCGFTKPYILCYFMGNDSKVSSSIVNTARQLATLTGYAIIRIGQKEHLRLNPFVKSVFDAGPGQFLGLFQNASFIVTNSFHGTTFSINFKKPFFVPFNEESAPEKTLNSRITTLLETLGLQERYFPAGRDTLSDTRLEINYQTVARNLESSRQKSIAFLRNSV
jgi:hypothetical protein